ncbi:MAG: ABC transporter ATP-binding protein [Alphaproteobacteria bacterium]|nr:ABC transporter ATP-binding protein [Alphaproteobacteria bacterium]
MTPAAGPASAVALHGITKRFPGVLANDAISLALHGGEVHALLGENGAGKSTLIGILAGMQQPDEGHIEIAGARVRINSPRHSLRLRIGTVFQHVLLVNSLTVIENLMLGGAWWRRHDRRAALGKFGEISQLLGVDIDAHVPAGRLSLGQQQQVEIIRALWHGGNVLVLDEPTSMLTPGGVKELGGVMRRLAEQGVAIVFVTHKLREAYAFGDRISVLRRGRLVGDIAPERLRAMGEEQATDEIIRLMFQGSDDAETLVREGHGRRARAEYDHTDPAAIRLENVVTRAEPGECALGGVSFSLSQGEVFGIAGVDGNGQKHLAELLAGQRPALSGSIEVSGRPAGPDSVAARRRLGVRYISDERLGEATVAGHSVATNLVLKEIGAPPYWQGGMTQWRRIFSHARQVIEDHDIRTPSEHTLLGRLSGGNIQKLLLAREISTDTSVVIFNKPTHGLDLHNTRLARQRIIKSAESGIATIVISTELDELLELCHRIGVMFAGELSGIVDNQAGAEAQIGRLMTGAKAA